MCAKCKVAEKYGQFFTGIKLAKLKHMAKIVRGIINKILVKLLDVIMHINCTFSNHKKGTHLSSFIELMWISIILLMGSIEFPYFSDSMDLRLRFRRFGRNRLSKI